MRLTVLFDMSVQLRTTMGTQCSVAITAMPSARIRNPAFCIKPAASAIAPCVVGRDAGAESASWIVLPRGCAKVGAQFNRVRNDESR